MTRARFAVTASLSRLATMSGVLAMPVMAQDGREIKRQAWTTVPDVVIGSEPGSDGALSRLRSVAVGAGGTGIVVVQSRRVSLWDPSRTDAPVLEFGCREGAAPVGEVLNVQADSADLMIRYSGGWGRFSYDGGLAEVWSNPPEEWSRATTMILPDGSFLARGRPPRPHRALEWGAEHPGWLVATAHVQRVGETWAADTLAMHRHPRGFAVAWPGNQGFSGQPFADHDLVYFNAHAGTTGIVRRSGSAGEVRVIEIAPDGDTAFNARFGVPSVPLGRERAEEAISEKSRSVARMLSRARDTLPSSEVRRMVEDALYLPTHLAPVTAVVPTASGEVWLRARETVGGESAVWYVLDRHRAQAPPRRVLLPDGFALRDATRTHVWGLRRGADFSGQVEGRRRIQP